MKVYYEDNHVIVVYKDPDITTQPGLEDLTKAYIKEKYQKPGNVFLHPVHRLDKVAKGLMLFARTSKALTRLNEEMRNKRIKKTYTAILDKEPKEKEGTLENHLVHGSHKAFIDPKGKLSLLNYKVIAKNTVEVDLITGRYHQIRAQFAFIGCPVVGDFKYGSSVSSKTGIELISSGLEFFHPVTKDMISITV